MGEYFKNFKTTYVYAVTILSLLLLTSSAYALIDETTEIGAGAVPISFTHSHSNVIHIQGGNVSAPVTLNTANTEYVLDGDITAPDTAIVINASNVILNLNDKKITYNTTSAGTGIYLNYNLSNVRIYNGSIEQGASRSTGDVYGRGSNPIRAMGSSANLEIAGVTATWYSQDTNGIHGGGPNANLHHNTLNDNYFVGVLANRMQGNSAIRPSATSVGVMGGNKIHHNKLSCRHRGIDAMNGDEVYNNEITIHSIATNSYGIFAFNQTGVSIHHNKIFGTGEHPIGIIAAHNDTMPAGGFEIFSNYIEVQATSLGTEYLSAGGNYAVGFRTTWGGNDINFYDNNILVHTDAAYHGTISDTGAPYTLNGKGRGLMLQARPGQKQTYRDNKITVLDKDGTGNAYGIALNGETQYAADGVTGLNDGSGITIKNNVVASNIYNVVLGDEYGPSCNYPLLISNSLVKVGSFPRYRTIATGLNGYNIGTGRFISNSYLAGASENSLSLNFQAGSNKSLIFGRLVEGIVQSSSGTALSDLRVRVVNRNGITEDEVVTDANGKAQFMIYDYELSNNNGATKNPVPLNVVFRPHTIELFDTIAGQALFATLADTSSDAWDGLTSSGSYTISDARGSITVTLSASSAEETSEQPASIDTTPPTVAITSPAASSTVVGKVTVTANANDNSGISRVEFYKNNVRMSTVTIAPYNFEWDTTQENNGSHSLAAKAYDLAGNLGQSATISLAVDNPVQDLTPPTVAITAPANSATVSGTVVVTASAADDSAVNRVEFFVDGSMTAVVNRAPYNFNLATASALSNGSHALAAKAYDAAGNSREHVVTVNVLNNDTGDVVAPAVSFIGLLAKSTLSGTVPISASASDNVGVTKVELYLNSTRVATSTSAPYNFIFASKDYYNSACTLTLKAHDAAGNIGTASVAVTIFNDKTAPTVSLTAPATGSTVGGLITVSATATDNVGVARVELYLNGALHATSVTAPFTFAWNTLAFTNGVSYTLVAKAYDAVGNVGTSASVTVTVVNSDSVAPSIGSFLVQGVSNSTTTAVTSFQATDNVGVAGYLITESPVVPAATASGWTPVAPTTFTFSGSGIRTAYGWVKDAAGNISAGKASLVVIDTSLPVIKSVSISGNSVVTIKATAYDNISVTKMQLFVDSVLQHETAGASLTHAWTVTYKGKHTLLLKAYDAAGNVRSQSVTFTK